MAASTSAGRAVERISRVCAAHIGGARSLQLTLLDEVRRTVWFDAHAWLLTDPQTEVGCAPVADVPCMEELPRLIRLKYLTTVNRWTRLAEPVALLRAATADHPEQSLVWRELLAGCGVSDVASVVFRCRHGCWGFLDLWRTTPASRFSAAEAAFLADVAGPITTALRRCQARTFGLAAASPVPVGPVVLVLSPGLDVRAQTPETDGFLRLLIPPGGERQPVPAGAYNVAAQLLAVEAGVDDHPPSARVHLTDGVWLTLRAARIGAAAPAAENDIAVTIEATPPAERTALLARACGLSARETELLDHVVAGSDTRTIAQRMFLSEHTVQDHLKSIFAKTGTANRRTLRAHAAGA